MPIPRQLIRSKASSNTVYERGLMYLNDDRVRNLKIEETDFPGVNYISATVSSNTADQHILIELDDEDHTINSFQCDCNAFQKDSKACKHIVAVLLTIENRFFNHPKKVGEPVSKERDTETGVKQLIQQYAFDAVRQTLCNNTSRKAEFVPIMHATATEVKLSFKLSIHGRTYQIKDLSQFKKDIIHGASRTYHRNFSFLHDKHNFSDDSLPLLQFFMAYYNEFTSMPSDYQKFNTDRKYMKLSPHMLDSFMQLLQKPDLLLCGLQIEGKQKIERRNPDFCINIKQSTNNYFTITLNANNYIILYGLSCIYILLDNCIYCCDEEFSKICAPLLKLLSQKGRPLIIKADDMTAFYVNVIQEVSRFMGVQSNGILAEFEPAPLTAKLYLDREDMNMVTAKLDFCYGMEAFSAFDNARKLVDIHDVRSELLICSILKKYFTTIDFDKQIAMIKDSDENVFALLSEGIDELSGYCDIYLSESFQAIQIRKSPAIRIGIRLESDLLDLSLNIDSLKTRELTDILASYRQRKRYHRLKDGSFINLTSGSLSELSKLATGVNINDKKLETGSITLPKYRALYLDSLVKDSTFLHYERDSQFKQMVRELKDVSDSDFQIPLSLKHILRNYQKLGFRWLKTLAHYHLGGILADDMGLGKTLEMISLLLSHKNEAGSLSALVVCPASLILNWESEILKFAPEMQVLSIFGTTVERTKLIHEIGHYDIVITSYDLLKRDIEEYKGYKFDFEIIDEAQYIKNHNTQNARSVKSIVSTYRFAMTGTPIENSLAELWSIFDYLMPGYLFAYHAFRERFEAPIVRGNDSAALEQLRKMTAPFILRRLKQEVLRELPEKTESIVYVHMDDRQRDLYHANVLSLKNELTQQFQEVGFEKSRFTVLAMLMKLRQICCAPELLYENYKGESAKLETCMELIQNSIASGHKILLFSQFTSMLHILQTELEKLNISHYMIEGSTDKKERLQLVNRFNVDSTPVFLISLKAGGTGLNLTGADTVIHYDPWWNVSVQNQATDRAHRIGQQKSVQVYKLIMKDSIEEKILKLQEKKLHLSDQLIMENAHLITTLSKEDIIRLFE